MTQNKDVRSSLKEGGWLRPEQDSTEDINEFKEWVTQEGSCQPWKQSDTRVMKEGLPEHGPGRRETWPTYFEYYCPTDMAIPIIEMQSSGSLSLRALKIPIM